MDIPDLRSRIIECADDAILSKTLDGRITSWNHACELMYGYTANEVIGTSIFELIPTDTVDELRDVLGKVSSDVPVRHFETTRHRKNGEVFLVSITMSPIRDDNNDIIGASSIIRDITVDKTAALAFQRDMFNLFHSMKHLVDQMLPIVRTYSVTVLSQATRIDRTKTQQPTEE